MQTKSYGYGLNAKKLFSNSHKFTLFTKPWWFDHVQFKTHKLLQHFFQICSKCGHDHVII